MAITEPAAGGYLTEALIWRWVFYINLPAGCIAFALGFWFNGFLAVDCCLDRDGRWNDRDQSCEGTGSR